MAKFSSGTFAIITGASQGIGRTIAVEFSKMLNDNSIILLLARSESGLKDTQIQISQVNSKITVLTFPLDLSIADLDDYTKIIDAGLSKLDQCKIENAVVFHNAGQVGVLDETTKLTDISVWRKYYDMNLFSVSLLNSVFITKLRAVAKKLTAVNISSLCGSKPFKNMSMYGSAKAARNLFFKVLAEEEPTIDVLNYSPGPVDTKMVEEVISNVKDAELKGIFTDLKIKKTILTTEQTVSKLLEILATNAFKSGDLVDYYDRI